MVQPPTRSSAALSHLVGPGPSADVAAPILRLGLCNLGEASAAVRLELELQGPRGAALVTGGWSGLLGRRSSRDLTARVDWSNRELLFEGRSFPFAQGAGAQAGSVLVARARLGPGQALEVGLRVPDTVTRP